MEKNCTHNILFAYFGVKVTLSGTDAGVVDELETCDVGIVVTYAVCTTIPGDTTSSTEIRLFAVTVIFVVLLLALKLFVLNLLIASTQS